MATAILSVLTGIFPWKWRWPSPGPSCGLETVFSAARLGWKIHGNSFPSCRVSPSLVRAFASIPLLLPEAELIQKPKNGYLLVLVSI